MWKQGTFIIAVFGLATAACEKKDTATPEDGAATEAPAASTASEDGDPLDDHERPDAGNFAFGGQSEDGSTVEDSGPVIDTTVSTEGSLDADTVTQRVNENMDHIGKCYQGAMERLRTDDLAGIVAVTFTVEASGKVSGATLEAESVGDADLAKCVVDAVASWKFPSPPDGKPTRVRFPFELQNH